MKTEKIVIIGNGIAGSTAARYIRKYSDHEITMISDETAYPYARTSLMYVFMGHVRLEDTKLYEDWFWEKNRIQLLSGLVTSVNIKEKNIVLDNGTCIPYDKLIIASGSRSNMLTLPGIELSGVQGLYHLRDLQNMEKLVGEGLNRAVIVGGGLIGIEMAEMFLSRHIPVTMVVREESYWNTVLPFDESSMINNHIEAHGIDLILNEEVIEIKGQNGKVSSVVCKNTKKEILCQFVGFTIGVSPNVDFLTSSGIKISTGVVTNEYLQTSAEDIYAIGDCVEISAPQPGRRSVEAVWYAGRMMGETVARTICGQLTKYEPGIWCNAAKFFDIEYQVFGEIPAWTPANITSLYWQHATENKSIRVNYETISGTVKGFNLMGIRYRQAACEKWIAEGAHIEAVLENLPLANFDPEFSDTYEEKLIIKYNQMTGKALTLKSK